MNSREAAVEWLESQSTCYYERDDILNRELPYETRIHMNQGEEWRVRERSYGRVMLRLFDLKDDHETLRLSGKCGWCGDDPIVVGE